MESTVRVTYERKNGRRYIEEWRCEDALQVYSDLAQELISKKINNCTWIRSIQRRNLYNGYQQITVNYNYGRRIYTVKD